MIFQRLIVSGGGTGGTGTAGNPVVSGSVNVGGELILTLQDGSSVNCGVVFDGTGNPVTSGAVNGSGELILTLDDGTQINAGVITQDLTEELAKLAAIEAGATANSTDAQLRDRSTHTGTQPISSVSGLQPVLDAKVDKVAGKQLSSEDYTAAEKDKLAGLLPYRQITKLGQAAGTTASVVFTAADPTLTRDVHALIIQSSAGAVTQTAADFTNAEASDFNHTIGLVFDGQMQPQQAQSDQVMANERMLGSGRVFTHSLPVLGVNMIRISGVI